MLFDNDMNTVLDVFIEKYGYLPTRHGYVPANAGARKVYFRLMRRARKARKNLVMYKTAGRRPWTSKFLGRLARRNESDALHKGLHYRQMLLGWAHNHEPRMRHLARCSGFLAMSRLATWLQQGNAHVPEVSYK